MSEVNMSGMVALAGVLFMVAVFVYIMALLRHRTIRQDLRRSEQLMIDAQTHHAKTSMMLKRWLARAEERMR